MWFAIASNIDLLFCHHLLPDSSFAPFSLSIFIPVLTLCNLAFFIAFLLNINVKGYLKRHPSPLLIQWLLPKILTLYYRCTVDYHSLKYSSVNNLMPQFPNYSPRLPKALQWTHKGTTQYFKFYKWSIKWSIFFGYYMNY